MSRVTWRGVTVDVRTAEMLTELAKISGPILIHPTQGSFSGGVSASAGTHDGCGAVDLMHPSWSVSDYDTVVREMRRVGFAAWHRTPAQSNWPHHVHAIAIQPGGKHDRGCLSSGAANQVIAYYDGLNGLAGRGRDDATRRYVGTTWESYKKEMNDVTPQDIERIAEEVAVRVNGILGDYDKKGRKRPGTKGVRANVRLKRVENQVRKIAKKVGA